MSHLSDELLQAIKARCAAATPKLWRARVNRPFDQFPVIVKHGGSGLIATLGKGTQRPEDCNANALFIAHAREDIPALLEHIEHLQRLYTFPCPYCDFGSGQRGVDRCPHCDDTVRMDVHVFVAQQRDAARAEAEGQKAALDQAWYVLDSAAAGVAPKSAAMLARVHIEKFIGPRESNFDDATREATSECRK